MQGCKAYRLCSVAVLNELGKEWWIDMKNVQISEELFVAIMRYFMLEQEEMLPQIKQGLEKKLDAMVMRELYTKYKTAPTEEEKEDLVELTGESVEDTVIRQMEIETLQKAMQSLTPVQRERLHFYFFEGMTYRQIAAKEGVGEKNIRESVNGAVKKIKKYFD